MQNIPRPTFTPSHLHNVGDDNGNAANRTKEYTKMQVAGQTMIDVHQVLAETVTYFTDASWTFLFSTILSALLLLLAQFQLSHHCIDPHLISFLLFLGYF